LMRGGNDFGSFFCAVLERLHGMIEGLEAYGGARGIASVENQA
jgi:hypothetical protein